MARPPKEPISRPMRVANLAFDLHKRGVARFDLRDPYHLAVTLSWPAFFGLAFAAILALNLIFAVLYILRPDAVENLHPHDVIGAMFFSLETLATVGYGEMSPYSTYGHVVAAIEILTGMTFTAIFTGILFVRFSQPQARILFADKAVITPHNGQPTLMLRIANGRLTLLTHALARVAVMIAETSPEGNVFRRVQDLRLMRDEMPIFPLTWTLMHVIDETSPVFGMDAEQMEQTQTRFFVAVEAKDAAMGATVQALNTFMPGQVAFGMRYSDAVVVDDSGRVTADISRLSLIE